MWTISWGEEREDGKGISGRGSSLSIGLEDSRFILASEEEEYKNEIGDKEWLSHEGPQMP